MIGVITSAFIGLSIQRVCSTDSSESPSSPFDSPINLKNAHRSASKNRLYLDENISSSNNWGFGDEMTEWPDSVAVTTQKTTTKTATSTPYYEEIDPVRNGTLKGIGSIDIGFGVGVGIPGNDPVRVGTRVGIGFGDSGLAGKLPIGQDIFPRQGQLQSLNDYDGDKGNIVADRAQKYWIAVKEGRIRIHHYRPSPSLVDVGGHIDIGIPG